MSKYTPLVDERLKKLAEERKELWKKIEEGLQNLRQTTTQKKGNKNV